MTGEWIDPKPMPQHDCRRSGLPAITWDDAGRRYRCACGKVWRVTELPDNARAHLDGPGWIEEPPDMALDLIRPEFDGPCSRPGKTGWRCTRSANHDGPCALKPRWWNLRWYLP